MIQTKEPWFFELLYKIGVPSAIAVFLVWFLAYQVIMKLDHLMIVGDSVSLGITKNAKVDAEIHSQNERIIQLLTRICLNSSKPEVSYECYK